MTGYSLCHGTSEVVARDAIQNGLRTRKATRKKSRWDVTSSRECVYLSKAYALHYAINAAPKKGRLAVLEVDESMLNNFDMLADEDALEQTTREYDWGAHPEMWGSIIDAHGDPNMMDMKVRTLWFRDRAHAFMVRGFGADYSLAALGNCAHYGDIPPGAITRVVLFHDWSALIMSFDPMVSFMNFQIMGEFYTQLQSLFMGRDFDRVPLINRMSFGDDLETSVDRVDSLVATVESRREILYDRET